MSDNVAQKFWVQNPSILIQDFSTIIPTKDMSDIQKYNAIVRFCLYLFIVLLLFKKSALLLYIPVVGILIITIMFYVGNKHNSDETFDNTVETGFFDSENKLRFNRTDGETMTDRNLSYVCRPPTNDNPFMNPDVTEYNTPAPVACNSDDENISDAITKSFDHNLFMDVNDVFEKVNSQRQFYTVPNTGIPNDQPNFANWLYKSPCTCKEDQEQCLRYEDLRFKR